MASARISREQTEAACRIASRVYDKNLRRTTGVQSLVNEHGLNSGSAGDFINDYACLVEGRVFHRGMSSMAMEMFMETIFAQRPSAARNAIQSLRSHIAYYEGHTRTTMRSFRTIADAYAARLPEVESLEEAEVMLSMRVISSLADPAARRARLAKASSMPRTRLVPVVVFERNPDVIAEVLCRANGVCEDCLHPAPFLRASTGTPYLEVHHRKRLADGGEDTVANAIALCPNCHRRLHYGTQDS